MILANITFGTRGRKQREELEDVAESYLSSLLHSGQLCDNYFLTWTKGRLNAHVALAGPTAMASRYHSKHGKAALKKVFETFGAEPVWRILDDDLPQRPGTWKGAPFLYLFTHAFAEQSPVSRGDESPAVPVYTLPISSENKEDLFRWRRSYYHHDHIWFSSGALEIAAYRQLADPKSELSESGRSLCQAIEEVTGIPTFYYLMRYWGSTKTDHQRRCPGCGGEWRTEHPSESPSLFWKFHFKCDHCRLVSHLAVAHDGGRHSTIGEFKSK